MDSWFVTDNLIKRIRAIKNGAMHLQEAYKLDKRRYLVKEKEMNSHQIMQKNERLNSKYCRKYKSRYISLVVDYKGERVRLFFIR